MTFNAAAALTTFAIVFPAELPDKTAIAALILGSRYRPLWAFAGTAAAFTVHVALAVTAGSLLQLLPHRWVEGIVAALFAVGAVVLLRGEHEAQVQAPEHEPAFWRTVVTSFTVIAVISKAGSTSRETTRKSSELFCLTSSRKVRRSCGILLTDPHSTIFALSSSKN